MYAQEINMMLPLPQGAPATGKIASDPPVAMTEWPGRKGASSEVTQIGPTPGPPPPGGMGQVL